MNPKYIIAAAFLCAAIPSHASAAKNATTLDAVKVDGVNIVRKGHDLNIDFRIDFTGVNLKSEQQIIYTPVFVGEGDSIVFEPVVLNGRNVAIKEERDPGRRVARAREVLTRKNGSEQNLTVSRTVPYETWMEYSHLYLSEDLCGCGNLQEQTRIPVGEFDNRPAPAPHMTFVAPKAEAVKARAEKGSAFVDYVVNKTNILPDYRRNRQEIAKIVATIDLVKNDSNVSITEINIHGYASPEGSYANNARLAEGRAASLKEYVKSLYTLADNLFTSNSTPEDWAGLDSLVTKSTIDNRDEILRIIRSDMEPDAKDHEIKRRFPQTYAFMLKEWYPGLRHSDYTVNYVVRPFTVEETKRIMKKNPRQVSLNEMFLVAQTYEPGSPDFNDVMEIAVKTYPDDPVANLNAACAALNAGEWVKARSYLAKADNCPEAVHARGVLAMNEGRYDEAEVYFKTAVAAGVPSAEENLRILGRLRRLAEQNRE